MHTHRLPTSRWRRTCHIAVDSSKLRPSYAARICREGSMLTAGCVSRALSPWPRHHRGLEHHAGAPDSCSACAKCTSALDCWVNDPRRSWQWRAPHGPRVGRIRVRETLPDTSVHDHPLGTRQTSSYARSRDHGTSSSPPSGEEHSVTSTSRSKSFPPSNTLAAVIL